MCAPHSGSHDEQRAVGTSHGSSVEELSANVAHSFDVAYAGQRGKEEVVNTPFSNAIFGMMATFNRFVFDEVGFGYCDVMPDDPVNVRSMRSEDACMSDKDDDYLEYLHTIPMFANIQSIAEVYNVRNVLLNACLQNTASMLCLTHPDLSEAHRKLLKLECALSHRQIQKSLDGKFEYYAASMFDKVWLSEALRARKQTPNMVRAFYRTKSEESDRDRMDRRMLLCCSKVFSNIGYDTKDAAETAVTSCAHQGINSSAFAMYCHRSWMLTRKLFYPSPNTTAKYRDLWQTRHGMVFDASCNRITVFTNKVYDYLKNSVHVNLSHNSLVPMSVIASAENIVYPLACDLVGTRDIPVLFKALGKAESACTSIYLDNLLLTTDDVLSITWSSTSLGHVSMAHNCIDISKTGSVLRNIKRIDLSDNYCENGKQFFDDLGDETKEYLDVSACFMKQEHIMYALEKSPSRVLIAHDVKDVDIDKAVRAIVNALGNVNAAPKTGITRLLVVGPTKKLVGTLRDVRSREGLGPAKIKTNNRKDVGLYQRVQHEHALPVFLKNTERVEVIPNITVVLVPMEISTETRKLVFDARIYILVMPETDVRTHYEIGTEILSYQERLACLLKLHDKAVTELSMTREQLATLSAMQKQETCAAYKIVQNKKQSRISVGTLNKVDAVTPQLQLIRDKLVPMTAQYNHLLSASTWLFMALIDDQWADTRTATKLVSTIPSMLFPMPNDVAIISGEQGITFSEYGLFQSQTPAEVQPESMLAYMINPIRPSVEQIDVASRLQEMDVEYARFLGRVGDFPRRLQNLCTNSEVGYTRVMIDRLLDSLTPAALMYIKRGLRQVAKTHAKEMYEFTEQVEKKLQYFPEDLEFSAWVSKMIGNRHDDDVRCTLIWYLLQITHTIYKLDVIGFGRKEAFLSRRDTLGDMWGLPMRLFRSIVDRQRSIIDLSNAHAISASSIQPSAQTLGTPSAQGTPQVVHNYYSPPQSTPSHATYQPNYTTDPPL